jgi:hypothetical protein
MNSTGCSAKPKENTMNAIFKRFAEPSSWAGLATLLAGFGVAIPAGAVQYISMGLAAISGLLAVFIPERSQS